MQIILTGVEGYLADHDPTRGEAESQLDKFANTMVQLDGDVPRVFEDPVLHVGIHDWIASVVATTDAEHYACLGEHLFTEKKRLSSERDEN